MFSVITNIYNKKTNEPTLMELFTATEKLKKFLPHTHQHGCIDILHCCCVYRSARSRDACVVRTWVSMCCESPVVHTSNFSSCEKTF
jgi:hypothetical protein